jgi:hypothetical protein
MSLAVRIHAVDETGAPVEGAVVHDGDIAVATTDANGVAVVSNVDTFFATVTVSHSMPAEARLVFSFGEGSSGIIDRAVTLRRGAALRGTVVTPDGTRLPGAVVQIWSEADDTAFIESDSDGNWCMSAMRAGAYEVRAGADGYARGPVVAGTHDGQTDQVDIVVRVIGGARLRGRVHERDGQPAVGVDVYAEMHPGDDNRATTDADGRFEISGLGAGRHRISVAQGRWISTVVMPDDGGELELDIELPDSVPGSIVESSDDDDATSEPVPTARLTGRVVCDGRPVSKFAIVRKGLADYRWTTDPAFIVATDGRFTLSDLRESSGTVHVLALGTAWTSTETLELEPGASLDLGDIVLERGLRITGTVCNTLGEPISNARVVIGRPRRDDALHDAVEGNFATTSGPDGTFVFDGVHVDDAQTRISACHPVHGASLHELLGGVDETVDLVLVPTGRIEGTLEPNSAMRSDLIVRAAIGEHGVGIVTARPSGFFAIENLIPGDYMIELVQLSKAPRRVAHVTVIAGQCTRVRMPPP